VLCGTEGLCDLSTCHWCWKTVNGYPTLLSTVGGEGIERKRSDTPSSVTLLPVHINFLTTSCLDLGPLQISLTTISFLRVLVSILKIALLRLSFDLHISLMPSNSEHLIEAG